YVRRLLYWPRFAFGDYRRLLRGLRFGFDLFRDRYCFRFRNWLYFRLRLRKAARLIGDDVFGRDRLLRQRDCSAAYQCRINSALAGSCATPILSVHASEVGCVNEDPPKESCVQHRGSGERPAPWLANFENISAHSCSVSAPSQC